MFITNVSPCSLSVTFPVRFNVFISSASNFHYLTKRTISIIGAITIVQVLEMSFMFSLSIYFSIQILLTDVTTKLYTLTDPFLM